MFAITQNMVQVLDRIDKFFDQAAKNQLALWKKDLHDLLKTKSFGALTKDTVDKGVFIVNSTPFQVVGYSKKEQNFVIKVANGDLKPCSESWMMKTNLVSKVQ